MWSILMLSRVLVLRLAHLKSPNDHVTISYISFEPTSIYASFFVLDMNKKSEKKIDWRGRTREVNNMFT